jgi:membrane-associated protease RseP (regulator of RpoE activity)
VERSCPRGWSLAAAVFVLSGAALVAGLGMRADAAPLNVDDPKEAQKRDEPKKEPAAEPRKDAEGPLDPADLAREIQKIVQDAPPGTDPIELQKRMLKVLERVQRGQLRGAPVQIPGVPGLPNVKFQITGLRNSGGRLGVRVSAPSPVLAEQLDLPAGSGLVIDEVMPDSAAAKAGLKPHDILVQLDGKDVTSNPAELQKNVDGLKADAAVEAVVLRKGKKETVKGIKVAEKEAANPFGPNFVPPPPLGVAPLPIIRGAGIGGRLQPGAIAWPVAGAANGVMTSVFRTDDRFTTRHQEGTLVITVTGTVADGKAKVSEIAVQDGATSSKHDSMDKVPEQYRDKVKNLIEMSTKSSVKIDIKSR